MKCVQCGHEMMQLEGMHKYDECGLKNVMLMNVPMHKCPSCKETDVEIPCMDELHLLLGFLVLLKPVRLSSEEARYLRKYLGYSQEELATYLGVSRITVTRWETEKPLSLSQEKSLRRMYLQKKEEELQKLPRTRTWRVLSSLADKLPLSSHRSKLQLRTEDWMNKEEEDTPTLLPG